MKLIKQKVLVAAGKKYIAGVDYKTEDIPAAFLKYFGGVSAEPVVEIREVEVIVEKEIAVPAFGKMSKEQLETLTRDQLFILAVQYGCEVKSRAGSEELVDAVLEAQEKLEEDGDE